MSVLQEGLDLRRTFRSSNFEFSMVNLGLTIFMKSYQFEVAHKTNENFIKLYRYQNFHRFYKQKPADAGYP